MTRRPHQANPLPLGVYGHTEAAARNLAVLPYSLQRRLDLALSEVMAVRHRLPEGRLHELGEAIRIRAVTGVDVSALTEDERMDVAGLIMDLAIGVASYKSEET